MSREQIEEMCEEKQIEEMAKLCTDKCRDCHNNECRETTKSQHCIAETLYNAGYRKQSENETLEAIDKFRSALMDKFIDLCRGNDFNKINLLLIGETIDRTFDDTVAKMKGGAE